MSFYYKALFFLLPFQIFAMDISYSVVDIETNKIVEQVKQNRPMVLASVSKIYSSYYVLRKLDPNSTFKTHILLDNENLIIEPSGDPFITAQNFINLIYQIKGQGITEIKGKFLVSTKNKWKTERLSGLGLEDQADNSALGLFNFEFNRFRVDRSSNKPIPQMSYLEIETAKLKDPGLKFKLKNKTENKEIWQKNIDEKHKFMEEVPVRDSVMFSAHFFRYLAEMHGLKLPVPEEVNKTSGRIIATHESLPVYRLIELCLEYSNNVIAEMLLQKVSPSNPEQASLEMLQWYKSEFSDKDFDWRQTSFVNASGLTLKNQTTAKNLSLVLTRFTRDKQLKRNFISYLSINGHSGGVRKRLRSSDKSFKIYAKTGSLFYVNNLAGYFRGDSGKLYAFAVFTTDKEKRELLNQKNTATVNKVRQENKVWFSKSSSKIDKLLASLIKKY